MTNVQVIDIVLTTINLSIATIVLLFAYQKMPQQFQKRCADMQLLSVKALKVIGFIMITGVFVQTYKHVSMYYL